MGYSQGQLTGLEVPEKKIGKFPVFNVENLATGEYAEVVEQTARKACNRLHWLEHNCAVTKNGYSHQYGRVLRRTHRKD